jgi:hypothetical protein
MATAAGHQVIIEQCVKGGAPLKKLWQKTKAKQIIPRGTEDSGEQWDVVVVQEDLPETTIETFHSFVDKFHESIVKTGARTLLFCPWSYPRLPEFDTEVIAAAHDEAAMRLAAVGGKVAVAHVGRLWEVAQASETLKSVRLYAEDKEHASPVGTELAAMCIYGHLFSEAPVVIMVPNSETGDGLGQGEELDELHRLAWESVSKGQ